MTQIIHFSTDTAGESEKRIMLPFTGFYDSEYTLRINTEIDSVADDLDLTDDQVSDITSNFDYNKYLKTVAEAYVDYLNQELSDLLPTPVTMTQVDIHSPTILAVMAESISAVIDVNQLPSVEFMTTFCSDNSLLDFKKNLQTIATDDLLSKDADISKMFDLPYDQWQNVHIECLLAVLVQVMQVNERGKESVNWRHDIVDFEMKGFIDYANKKNALDVNIKVS